jgi:hypothetical protein
MAVPRIQGFIADCQTLISEQLRITDAWSALQQEYAAMTTNNALPTQPDIDAVFGTGVLTLAQFNAAISGEQEVVDYVHTATRAAKLYRVKR